MNTRASRRKHHVIYKTTCLITGKWYIGMHSTDDLDDGYIGSGQRLWKSIKKYGKEQHKCEVLEHLPNREALSLREEEIVSKEIVSDPMCMNLQIGGTGRFPGYHTTEETRKKKSEAMKAFYSTEEGKNLARTRCLGKAKPPEAKAKIAEAMRTRVISSETREKMSRAKLGRKLSVEHRAKISASNTGKPGTMLGKFHSEDTKRKIAESVRIAKAKR